MRTAAGEGRTTVHSVAGEAGEPQRVRAASGEAGEPQRVRAASGEAGEPQRVRAVFLDRDGVINKDVLVVRSFKEMQILPNALQAIARLAKSDHTIIMVTNKGSIGVGLLSEKRLAEVHKALLEKVSEAGGRIDAIYHCPHLPLPVFGCDCRKPKPGLILRAARERDIDLNGSWMVGDNLTDVRAGRAAGCRTILLTTTHGEKIRARATKQGVDHVAKDLAEAVDLILSKEYFEAAPGEHAAPSS